MNQNIPVFEKTLSVYHEKIMAMPWDRFARSGLLEVSGGRLALPWFNEILVVTVKGMVSEHGTPVSFETAVVVYNYLLMFQDGRPKEKGWISFRDIRDSGPLSVYFADNVEKQIAGCFQTMESRIMAACVSLDGYEPEDDLAYDVVLAFDVLPTLSLLLLFNPSDDDFPATCKVLFSRGAETVLDTESLAILAVIFANRLCG